MELSNARIKLMLLNSKNKKQKNSEANWEFNLHRLKAATSSNNNKHRLKARVRSWQASKQDKWLQLWVALMSSRKGSCAMHPAQSRKKRAAKNVCQEEQEDEKEGEKTKEEEEEEEKKREILLVRQAIRSDRLAIAAIFATIIVLVQMVAPAQCVDCFKCSSRNGSNPACEDPFHNLNATKVISPLLPDPQPNVIYHAPCYAGRKGRDGLFPASACIKLTGIFDTTGETLVVRHCALDSGTLTQDTELARMSHCGKFQFEGDLLRGCVLACPEDACNGALPRIDLSSTTAILPILLLLLVASTSSLVSPLWQAAGN